MTEAPKYIDDRLEQYREPIKRSSGTTESEQHLSKLTDGSFLNLWSYPNPFIDKKQNEKGDGKELCDVLVVCDPYVLIFSEKNIKWKGGDVTLAWKRWSRRAIQQAATQTAGAERWIAQFPDRIYTDSACTQPLPIDLPPLDRRRVHRIVVARGAGDACKEYFGGEGTGSLLIIPEIKDAEHWDGKDANVRPFCLGDIDSEGSFVHVLDDGSLDFVLSELDTITDFTAYLEKKEKFIRSGHLGTAYGEEDLVAYYSVHLNSKGEHDFVHPEGRYWREGETASIAEWSQHYVSDPQYIAKKNGDRISYLWDKMIVNFTEHMLNGTSITLDGFEFNLKDSENSVRFMALENRLSRRSHGQAIFDAMEKARTSDGPFFRSMLPGPSSRQRETAFFIFLFPYMDWMDERGGYELYRNRRTNIATLYAQAILIRARYLKRVIGIAMESPGRGRGGSEDLVHVEPGNWTRVEINEIKKQCKQLGIAQNFSTRRHRSQEFPDIEPSDMDGQARSAAGNRKQRRARIARVRRGRTRSRHLSGDSA